MTEPILSFFGEYKWLSNFYMATVPYENAYYPSTEHAYHAAKTLDLELRKQFANPAMTCAESKRAGHALKLRPDWEEVKRKIMRGICAQKFICHPYLAEKLIATGDAHLEEGNNHGDRYWGTVYGKGRNELGKILMEIRENMIELKKALAESRKGRDSA